MTEWLSLPAGGGRDGSPRLSVRIDPAPLGSEPGWGILYLHGFGSSHSGEKADFFRDRATASGIPICSFDFRGHGASGGRLLDLTLSRSLEDVGRVMEALEERGWDRIVILGS